MCGEEPLRRGGREREMGEGRERQREKREGER